MILTIVSVVLTCHFGTESGQNWPKMKQVDFCVIKIWRDYQILYVGAHSEITKYIHDASSHVDATESPWEVPLEMIIPREPQFWSSGMHIKSQVGTPALLE
jgi:hypothetical protein